MFPAECVRARICVCVCVWECVCVCVPTGCSLGQALPRKPCFHLETQCLQDGLPPGKLGLGASGGEGAACSPDAEAFVEAGALSPGRSHGLSPKVQLRAGWTRLNTRSLGHWDRGHWRLLQELGAGALQTLPLGLQSLQVRRMAG